MKKLALLLFSIIFTLLLPAQQYDSTNLGSDEAAVKSVIERFLEVAGSYDTKTMATLFTENANIGGASYREGNWKTYTKTIEEFIAELESSENPQKYTEPVSKYTIHIDQGKLAFVKADATLVWDGKAQRNNFDYFTLINQNGTWKILNGSYVSIPIVQ